MSVESMTDLFAEPPIMASVTIAVQLVMQGKLSVDTKSEVSFNQPQDTSCSLYLTEHSELNYKDHSKEF